MKKIKLYNSFQCKYGAKNWIVKIYLEYIEDISNFSKIFLSYSTILCHTK
jgi:hypothetical protein